MDISAANVAVARERYPEIEFRCGDFRNEPAEMFDVVVLSDVLEHVPDDDAFLRAAAARGKVVLLNLPLEDNWLNRKRRYGPDDVSGHLRKYSLADGLALVERAGLELVSQAQVWVHETAAEPARRALRQQRLGAAFSGAWPARTLRRAVFAAVGAAPPLGRRLFASNLFVAARARPGRPPS